MTETSIRLWFSELYRNLTDDGLLDIMNDPSRIFNADEASVQLCPKSSKVIGMRGMRNCYEISPGDEKSNLTFLATISATGEIACPTVLYPYIRLPKDIKESFPDDFCLLKNESGWMTSDTFTSFITDFFDPWLIKKNIQKPVLLFLDGHRSHMTLQFSAKSEDRGIIIYRLPPNSTHILQPADVGFFKSLKSYFRQICYNKQRDCPDNNVKRKDVAPRLKDALQRIKPQSIINSFRKSGLFPLNVSRQKKSKMLQNLLVQRQLMTSSSQKKNT